MDQDFKKIFDSLLTYLSTLGLAECFLKYSTGLVLFCSFVCALVLFACCVSQELHKALLTVIASPCLLKDLVPT